ncbi:hypothetical protein MVES1_000856 [Malassezia vespertilionis]|uniref:Centromere protein H C-terminal domain-containing protein n=1 Tax=Malassezia vespertilionis TaxID=2020962 RepID=A0A2N1JE93_9BASI|nr:uncharacterized protein MVES1_000856 [Malassezia vespertilionis]PKI84865.1 hypothetical protein MVES_000803 [Malassezia vespertilionis]WFD05526.1 hypothetical protein MVES1_000856 [Malassezia vespertilionis]
MEEQRRALHALEQACAVRGAMLASVESSFAVVQSLQASDDGASVEEGGDAEHAVRGIRALLRKRDALALQILETQHALQSVQEQEATVANEIERTRDDTISVVHAARQDAQAKKPDAAEQQCALLKGVILHLAMKSKEPWWNDPQLTEIVLSMDTPGA